MRVIAGEAKGTRLKSPSGLNIRPTADRVKEALFSIISPNLADAVFVDLFAGSGAIGIEALSRGAERCIFVDKNKKSISLIQKNLAITKFEKRSRVICADIKKAIKQFEENELKANIIFLDPPYNYVDLQNIVRSILNSNILKENGLVIVEHDRSNIKWTDSFGVTKQKKYGDTYLTFFYLKTEDIPVKT